MRKDNRDNFSFARESLQSFLALKNADYVVEVCINKLLLLVFMSLLTCLKKSRCASDNELRLGVALLFESYK